MPDIALLLTACIKVSNPDFVKRNKIEQRLDDYKQSLRDWLTRQRSIKKFIFCDNSGYPLDELKAVAEHYKKPDQQVEFLSYTFSAYDQRGYGWAELDIYEYAWRHSRLLKEGSYTALCGGRLFIRNNDSLCRLLPDDFDIVVDLQHNLTWADQSYFFVRSNLFLDEFVRPMKILNDNSKKEYTERALAKVILGLIQRDYRWYPMPVHPLYCGYSGKKNEPTTWRLWSGRFIPNRIGSWLSNWHYRVTYTSYRKGQKHFLDTLPATRKPPTIN